jgi:8-amino-7-oxononanoate synthase
LRHVSRLFLDAAKTRGWNTGTSAGFAIIPIMAGNSVFAVALSQGLFERGINVQPIIHPAVPERAARLRFFLTSEHRAAQIDETIQAIEDAMKEVSANPSMQNIPGFPQGGPA